MTTTASPPVDLVKPGAADETAEIPVLDPAATISAPVPQDAPEAQVEDQPRVLSTRTTDEAASMIGSAVGAFGFVWIFYYHVLPWTGLFGFLVAWWLAFLAFYTGVTALANPAPVIVDRVVAAVMCSGAAVVFGVLAFVCFFIAYHGFPAYSHWNFYTDDMSGVAPTDPLNRGGVLHAVVGTGYEVGIASVISLPLGVGTAVFLTEVGGAGARVVRTVVEAMTALPDILAGLFIYTTLVIGLGWEKTGFTVSIALAVTMIPIIARSAEVVLRVVPGGLREAGMSLGASTWQTVWRVVLPTARSGLATSLILGIARIAGETAPLLIVSGASTYMNKDPFSNSMNSLPLFIYTAVRSPAQSNVIARAYGAATLLLVLVLTLFVITRFLARDKVRSR